MTNQKINPAEKYKFLHTHIAREAFIYDVLNEISLYQEKVLRTNQGSLVTLDDMKISRNIKIPFNHIRNKTIAYLVDLLIKNYPDEIRTIVSFDFTVDPITKKLTIDENIEYTVQLNNESYNRIQNERDDVSVINLLNLLTNFRLFNLTKLLKKAKNKTHLSRIIKSQLGNNIFTFKNYSVDRHAIEIVEDYCFHKNNYDNVKKSLDIEEVKKIISMHSVQITRRLKKFGIVSADFSDYRDSKLDYLLNILLDDIHASLTEKDLMVIKNFHSLRACLAKVDKVIDPLLTVSTDIIKYIKENDICKLSDLIALFDNIPEETISEWIEENEDTYKIISYTDDDGETYFIDGKYFLPKLSELHLLILYQQDIFSELGYYEREKKLSNIEFLCNAGRKLLNSDERSKLILENEVNVNKLNQIIKEYDDYMKRISIQGNLSKEKQSRKKNTSIIKIISSFFKSLFSTKDSSENNRKSIEYSSTKNRIVFSKKTRNIFNKIKLKDEKIIPLSNFIDLTPENELQIDTIIEELRSNNLKIVIPIYNARKNLYPNRSQKYLISDVEYILVNPEIIIAPETIREFTDSLPGYKIKDETIPGSAILAIEKYLLTLYRQKRALMLKKDK